MGSVRDFREDDRPAAREVYLESRRRTFTWLNVDGYRLEDFDKDTADERLWVYENDGEVSGFISVYLPANFIHHLYILPQHAGKGFGAALLHNALACIGRPARLKCLSRNGQALAFYAAMGWVSEEIGNSQDGSYHLMAHFG
ncbi:GNAT family N-acetyltransferase [Proteobacteria bacterium 005FR1]|nr:GNAT family N-acetyltransferase [Proteobacteria bacterium 005FR1]